MRTKSLAFLARALRPIAVFVYALIKLARRPQHRVTFISRQSDSTPIDFALLAAELSSQDRSLVISMLCVSDATRSSKMAGHLRQSFKELWFIARSRAVVLDGYALSVSYFPQRKSLYVLQMWHALGAIKRFSWQAVDTPGGRSSVIAHALRMHANYSTLLASGPASVEIYRHAFRTPRSRIHVLPLPRTDYLRTPDPNRCDALIANNPDFFKTGSLIFYAPTFRDTDEASLKWLDHFAHLLDAANSIGATLVLKTHMREHHYDGIDLEQRFSSPNLVINPEIDTLDLLTIVDHVITDYSAVAFEAAVAGKPLWFYIPDYEEYSSGRGLNVDLKSYMPNACFSDALELMESLRQTTLPTADQAAFLKSFVQLSPQLSPQLIQYENRQADTRVKNRSAAQGVSCSAQIARLVLKGIQ